MDIQVHTREIRLLRIRGRVQGVYFRASMVGIAAPLGADGWVRNRSDGSVEALVAGPPDVVAQLIDWARSGPSAARVTEVLVSQHADDPGPGSGFVQAPDA